MIEYIDVEEIAYKVQITAGSLTDDEVERFVAELEAAFEKVDSDSDIGGGDSFYVTEVASAPNRKAARAKIRAAFYAAQEQE